MNTKWNRLLSLLLSIMLLACVTPSLSMAETANEKTDVVEADSADLKAAFSLGIADDTLLGRLEETNACTQKEAATLLNNVYALRRTQENLYLKDMQEHADPNKAASRYWMAQGMYFSNLQERMNVPYQDYITWMDTYGDFNDAAPVPEDVRLPDAMLVATNPDIGKLRLYGCLWDGECPDNYMAFDAPGAVRHEDCGSHVITTYAALLYDRTNGAKVMQLDENGNFHPQAVMSVEEAILTAMRYYRSFEDEQKPVAFAQVGEYDATAISDEILSRQSILPEASCQQLPAEWHSVLLGDMAYVCVGALSGELDKTIYEADIKAVHDAGFNGVGLMFSFSYLQGPVLQDGMFNESRLIELDQLIGWCLKYDLHVDLRCTQLPGMSALIRMDEAEAQRDSAINQCDEQAIHDFAAAWGALAKRYSKIFNRDLSFNLLVEPYVESEEIYGTFFTPAVEAIRVYTRERCIIADIHSGNLTGESMAQQGVALSYHLYEPRSFCAPSGLSQQDMERIKWPYKAEDGRIIDAEQTMNELGFIDISANDLIATAKQYNVGVTIGEFGSFADQLDQPYWYSQETQEAFLRDMTDMFRSKGVSWCYGVWNGVSGLAGDYPILDDVSYEKLPGTTQYINTELLQLFREINQ